MDSFFFLGQNSRSCWGGRDLARAMGGGEGEGEGGRRKEIGEREQCEAGEGGRGAGGMSSGGLT